MGADERLKRKIYSATRYFRNGVPYHNDELDAEIERETGLDVSEIASALDYGIHCPPPLSKKVSEGLSRVGASIGDVLQAEATADEVSNLVKEDCKERDRRIAEKRSRK